MPAVGGRDAEAPLAASPDAMLLHQPLHTLLAYTNALSPQLPPDARPAVGSAILRISGADVNQQRFVAQMTALGYLPAPRQMLVVTGHAYAEYTALHPDRPDSLVLLKKAYFTSGPLRRTPWLFPGCRAPSSLAPTLHADV